MKNLQKILIIMIIMLFAFASAVFASDVEYIVTRELTYESVRKLPVVSGFVEILIGNMNFVQYQEDNEIVVTPKPDEIREDEYGNMYIYYDLSGFGAKEKFKVITKRECAVSAYTELIPTRSATVINAENQMFLYPKERIESDEPELIAKAKELTEGITTDYKKAEAIFAYVNVNMSYDTSSAYANKGALSALESMKGVCEEFATLFVAMCRAVDIPSRVIEGYKIQDEKSGDEVIGTKLVDHVWGEIYLEEFGWVPVEPTIEYSVGGERKPYFDSFGNLKSTDYIAIGIYNYEKANRRMKNVNEIEYKESYIKKSDIVPDKENSFEDISEYTWATDAIQSLYAKGVVEGYSDSLYGPQNNISRIEFICMLSRMLEYYGTQKEEGKGLVYYYPDYDESHWSKDDYDFLLKCYQILLPDDSVSMGYTAITNVFGVGSLNMNKPITRAEALGLLDLFLDDEYDYTANFSDINFSKFKNSIIKAYSSGLITGYPDGTFKPNNQITRAEMAVILNRFIVARIYVI